MPALIKHRHLAGVQVLRGVAALMVVYAHAISMRWGMGITIPVGNGAATFLVSGVDIFFVISGFIITRTASEAGAAGGRSAALEFFLKRIARIYPVYWFILLAAVLSSLFIKPGAGLSFSPSLAPDVWLLATRYIWYVPQAWSLCFEMHFYIVLTIVILIAPRHVIALGAFAIAVCGYLGMYVGKELLGPLTGPLTLEFGFGVLVAIATQYLPKPRSAWLFYTAAAAFFITGACLLDEDNLYSLPRIGTYGFGSALLVYAVVVAEFRGAKFSPNMQYFGDISYSLYICHLLIFKWLAYFSKDSMFDIIPGPIQITIWIGITILISMALFERVENPSRWWLHTWIARMSKFVEGFRWQRESKKKVTVVTSTGR